MKSNVPSMLDYILQQQQRGELSPEEEMLLASAEGVRPQMVAANEPKSWLRSIFSGKPPQPTPPQQPQNPARRAEDLFDPGSIGDQMRRRREEADRMGKELSLAPEDMLMAQAPDPYGGVSVQTRSALDQAGREDPTGDLGDMIVGKKAAGGGGIPAKTTVRGKQTSAQEEQLIKLLMNRGMSEKDARTRARGII